MFPVTITLHNPAQLNAVLAAMGSEIPVPVIAAKPEAEAPKPTVQKEKAETKKSTKAQPSAEAQSSDATQTASTSSDDSSSESTGDSAPVSYQEAATAVTTLSRTKGRDAAVAVLKKFNAAKLSEVEPEQFAAVVKACEEATA